MNDSKVDRGMFGKDVRQTHVVVDDVDVLYSPHESMGYLNFALSVTGDDVTGNGARAQEYTAVIFAPTKLDKNIE